MRASNSASPNSSLLSCCVSGEGLRSERGRSEGARSERGGVRGVRSERDKECEMERS